MKVRLILASLVSLEDRLRSLSNVDITRTGAVSLFAMRARAADADVLPSLQSFNGIQIGSDDPDLSHVACLSVAAAHREDHSNRRAVDRAQALLNDVAKWFGHGVCGAWLVEWM